MPWRRFVLALLAAGLLSLLAGCPNQFGYYPDKLDLLLRTPAADTSPTTAVAPPVFYTVSSQSGVSRTVTGLSTENDDQRIIIETPTEDALVYYTRTEGVGVAPEPALPNPYHADTLRYTPTRPIVVSGNNSVVRIRAIAFKPLMIPSAVSSLDMHISYGTGTGPSFDHTPGVYRAPFTLVISDLTPAAVIWYTTDGSEPVPNAGSTLSNASPVQLAIAGSTMVRAVVTAPNLALSSETAAQFLFTPGQPTISRIEVAGGKATAFWQAVPGALSYNLYYRPGANVTPADGTELSTSATSLTVGGLAGATEYAFTLAAVNTNGEGLPSSVATAIPLLPPPDPLTVAPASTQAVAAAWNAVPGAAEYAVYCSTTEAGPFDTPAWRGSSTSALVTGLAPGSSYFFAVSAVDESGREGPVGSVVAARTYDTTEMPAITNVPTGSLPAPTQLPPGTDPASDYWIRTVTLGWTQGGYTYAVWDQDYAYSDAFMVVAYDAQGGIVAEWMFTGNSKISSLSVDPVTGVISFVNDWDVKTTTAAWNTLKL